jgi:autotransporter-associated beta strand protein
MRSGSVSAKLGGTVGLNKTTGGIVTLTGANEYSGTTTVSEGTLVLSGSGSISYSPIINIASGASLDTTGLSSTFRLASGQTMKGSGTVAGNIAIGPGSFLSPGNSPGIEYFSGYTELWEGGGTYTWELLNAAGTTPGTDWDLVSLINGADLSITATSGSKFNISIKGLKSIGPDVPGTPTDFNPNLNYSWMILQGGVGSDITGFSTDKFNLSVSDITGAELSKFSLSLSGNDIMLNYTSVPEPATVIGFVIAALGMVARKRLLRPRRGLAMTGESFGHAMTVVGHL